MKLFALAPLLCLITSVAAAPSANPEPVAAEAQLEKRAVTGYVTHNNVYYRTCQHVYCTAGGQYHQGQRLSIVCMIAGDYGWWSRLTNGYYISNQYVNTNGVIIPYC